MIYVTTTLSAIALGMAVLALAGVGIVIHNIKSDKPIIRRVKGIPIKSVQRNGNVERIDEDCGNWAEKLTLYNIDYPTMPDVNYKCPKCDSKILLGAETKKVVVFIALSVVIQATVTNLTASTITERTG